jgi:glycosyltransferase involved in cell wall biosynthesis
VDLAIDVARRSRSRQRTIVFVGRLCKIKNLHFLLAAWTAIQDRFPDARLRIIGPDYKGHGAQLRRAAYELGAARVSIEAGAWGSERELVYRQADALILPSLSESFGLVVAEALAAGLPVITTTGTPWQNISSFGCGWCVVPTPEALAGALEEALGLADAALAEMGRKARRLAEEQLSWATTLPAFVSMYDWLVSGGSRPDFISP